MSLDLYQPCPGGLDKKIKFCCKDLAHQLESVSRKLDGEQLHAAEEELDRLLQQYPDRQCLWSLKVQSNLALNNPQAVRESNQKFLDLAPKNPIALAVASILSATEEYSPQSDERPAEGVTPECRRAIDQLQSALENSSDAIPVQIYDALGVMAERLIAESMFIAAREHLAFQIMLDRENSQAAFARFLQLSRSSTISILLRQDMTLPPPPEESVSWKEAYVKALASGSRGLWREAANQLESLVVSHDAPLIHRAMGVLYCRLAENKRAVAAWRKFAQSPGIDHEDAVEAEALSQLLDPPAATVELMQCTLPVKELDAVLTVLQSDKRFQALRFDASSEGDGPPPKAMFQMQDRVIPEAKDLAVEDLPQILSEVLLFGKETDQSARIVFVTVQDRLELITNQLKEILGEQITGELEKIVLAKISQAAALDTMRPALPRDGDRSQHVQWARSFMEDVVLAKWSTTPLEVLHGKTPSEAAQDPKLHIALEAAVFNLDLQHGSDQDGIFTRLRERLSLPAADRIVADAKVMRYLPLVRFHRLDSNKLSDDDLLTGFALANQTRHAPALVVLARELLNRPGVQGKVKRDEIFGLLASLSEDADEALQLTLDAQKAAIKAGGSPARWKVSEFSLRVMRQEGVEAQSLLGEIQSKHLREPGIADLLMTELTRFGLVPRGTAGGLPAQQRAAATTARPVDSPAGSIIVSGDSDSAAKPEGDSPPSKLWLPGMD